MKYNPQKKKIIEIATNLRSASDLTDVQIWGRLNDFLGKNDEISYPTFLSLFISRPEMSPKVSPRQCLAFIYAFTLRGERAKELDKDFVVSQAEQLAGIVRLPKASYEELQRMLRQATKKNICETSPQTTFLFQDGCPLEKIFLKTAFDSQQDLLSRVETARRRFIAFGLTRNFFARDDVRDLLLRKSYEIPTKLFLMDPRCESRKDRYRVESTQAALGSPERATRDVISPFRELLRERKSLDGEETDGACLRIYLYNFPCSFAVEIIDDACRIMLYGHGKAGTESPILIFKGGTPYFEYFYSQIEWLEKLATKGTSEPWRSKKIKVQSLRE